MLIKWLFKETYFYLKRLFWAFRSSFIKKENVYWYFQDIEKLEKREIITSKKPKVAFYGSSSFTLWQNITTAFPEIEVVNLGFGGSTLAACAWFYDRVVPRHAPEALFIYAGDNDLGDGRTSEEVIMFYNQLVSKVRQTLGHIPICFVSIKLSPSRKHLRASIQYTNSYICEHFHQPENHMYYVDVCTKMLDDNGGLRNELYQTDGLHLNDKGYAIWQKEISQLLARLFSK